MVLPQPDSPTRPSVSPRPIAKLTSSTARTIAAVRSADAAACDGEMLAQVLDLEQRLGAVTTRRRRAAISAFAASAAGRDIGRADAGGA